MEQHSTQALSPTTWRFDSPRGWSLYPVTEKAASQIRTREIDAWLAGLEAMGQARVIRVEDMGAAMEASARGAIAAQGASDRFRQASPLDRWHVERAAHLARLALGES